MKGEELQKEFEGIVRKINKHTEEGIYDNHWSGTKHYCECEQCHINRERLTVLSKEMTSIGYARKADNCY
jgi:hypothetical protein